MSWTLWRNYSQIPWRKIPTKVLKESIVSILNPITHIINLSLITGKIPTQLKVAKVIPVYKASDHNLLKNYRPISLLPSFAKLKIMFNKLMSFLESQPFLYTHQYGFRPKHSTIHPIMHLLNKCAEITIHNQNNIWCQYFLMNFWHGKVISIT